MPDARRATEQATQADATLAAEAAGILGGR